jgi:hypothetical protein
MDRFEINNIYRSALVQKDVESFDAEKLSDIPEVLSTCSGDICGISWKPKTSKNENGEDVNPLG